MDKDLLKYLLEFVSENKRNKFNLVLAQRTRHLTVVLEDIYQPQNASAVVRSCECFGIQDLHIIENDNKYKLNPDVAMGSAKWVDLFRYNKKGENNTLSCISGLKQRGYKIWATSPHKEGINLDELPLDHKVALLFGRETDGLSEDALSMADGFVSIPMAGFTESLNISVCAAIFLHHLTLKLRTLPVHWQLTEAEDEELRYRWVRKVITRVDLLEQEYYKKKGLVS